MFLQRTYLISFYFACNRVVEGITFTDRNFVIEKGVQANGTIQSLDSFNTTSFYLCAAECSKQADCCSSSYVDDSSCKLYKCCFPETVPSTGGKHLRKIPYNTEVRTNPKDCSELPTGSSSGVYTIHPTATQQFDVYCEIDSATGSSWTVVQRRIDGTVNFYLNWASYKAGFGDLTKEFWIGNDILNILTTSKRYILRFDIADYDNETVYAEYDTFVVADESEEYKLTIGCYSGTAGDTVSILNGMKFTTLDQDNDVYVYNCADSRQAGWWFRQCSRLNPNGIYKPSGSAGFTSIYWELFRAYQALASMSMKIRPL